MPRLRGPLLAVLAFCLLAAPVAEAAKRVPLLSLQGGTTTIAPDPGFASALQGLGVTATALEPGRTNAAGAFVFGVVWGRLAGNEPGAGQIRHFGGLRLGTADGNHVDLNNLRINDNRDVAVVTAQIGSGPRIVLAKLDVSDSLVKVTRRRLVLGDVGLLLSGPAAEALNAQFATTAFSEGLRIGAATIRARIRVKLKPLDR